MFFLHFFIFCTFSDLPISFEKEKFVWRYFFNNFSSVLIKWLNHLIDMTTLCKYYYRNDSAKLKNELPNKCRCIFRCNCKVRHTSLCIYVHWAFKRKKMLWIWLCLKVARVREHCTRWFKGIQSHCVPFIRSAY